MLYLVIASTVWAFSYGLIKANLTALDPNFVTFCRMAFALPLFVPFLRLKKISVTESLQLVIIGAIQFGLMYLFFIRSFQYLKAHEAVLFTTLTPLYVVIINDIFSRKWSPHFFMVALLAVLGGGIIYYQNQDGSVLKGFWYVQAADICFAFGQVAYKRFRQLHTTVQDKEIYALLFLGALIVGFLSTTGLGGWSSLEKVTLHQWLVMAYLGSIASGICFFWWNKGGLNVNTGTLAVFNNLKSPLGIVVCLIFFHEETDIIRLCIGLGLIVFALLLSERYNRKEGATRSLLRTT